MAEIVTRVNNNMWVIADDVAETAVVVRKREVRDQLQFLRAQIATLPEPMTNAELLAWAKEHYPQSGQEESRRKIRAEIDRLQGLLERLV